MLFLPRSGLAYIYTRLILSLVTLLNEEVVLRRLIDPSVPIKSSLDRHMRIAFINTALVEVCKYCKSSRTVRVYRCFGPFISFSCSIKRTICSFWLLVDTFCSLGGYVRGCSDVSSVKSEAASNNEGSVDELLDGLDAGVVIF